jgi:hypothetical protein
MLQLDITASGVDYIAGEASVQLHSYGRLAWCLLQFTVIGRIQLLTRCTVSAHGSMAQTVWHGTMQLQLTTHGRCLVLQLQLPSLRTPVKGSLAA